MKMSLERTQRILLIIALQILIIAASIAFGWWFYHKLNETTAKNSGMPQPSQVGQPPVQAITYDVNSTSTIVRGQVTWLPTPQKITSLGLFTTNGSWDGPTTGGREGATDYTKVGTVKSGPYTGADIIVSASHWEGMGEGITLLRMLRQGDKLVLLPQYSDEDITQYPNDTYIPAKFVVNKGLVIQELEVPQQLIGPNPRQVLVKQTNSAFTAFDVSAAAQAFVDPTWGPVYQLTQGWPDGFNSRGLSNGFVIRMADGSYVMYAVKPDIADYTSDSKSFPNVTWYTSGPNGASYNFAPMGGCGRTSLLDVANDVSIANDLIAAGKTAQGDTVYEYKNTKVKDLKDLYDQYTNYSAAAMDAKQSGTKLLTYEQFVKAHPLFFWVDAFGDLVRWQRSDFQLQGECGKPVIYLYPQQEQRVDVKVEPQGGMTYSDPDYRSGWSVVAEPNGDVRNLADQKTYPYLFWEGRGGLYSSPQQGWVIKKSQVHAFLVEKLAALGFNSKESTDFIEFWEPRMQAAPYYFVGFHGTQVMNQLAPLTVTPRPDSLLRVLMDYQPLQHPISVTAPTIPTFQRHGFAVVEWGGVLRGEKALK